LLPFIFIDPGSTQVSEAPEHQLEAETLDKEQRSEPATKAGQFSRKPILLLSLFALLLNGAAAIYTLPSFQIALPHFNDLAEWFPHGAAPAPIPDPAVAAALKDIERTQEQHAAALQDSGSALQQNTMLLQQETFTLDSLRQGVAAQQTDVKKISAQLSALIGKVDVIQNAVAPETTSSISQLLARDRMSGIARRKTSRFSRPEGPVSVRGAPLSRVPPPDWSAG
jgi:uncharacterized coiled-coil protein SlyX